MQITQESNSAIDSKVKPSENCDCNKFTNTQATVTNVSLEETTVGSFLKAHCVSYFRLYIQNEAGEEYEKYEFDCMSNTPIKYIFSEETNFSILDEKGRRLSREKGKKFFLKLINSTKRHYFEFELDSNKRITQVSVLHGL